MNGWQPISTAPKDGTPVVCWRKGWWRPTMLFWKTNRRIEEAMRRSDWDGSLVPSYFGDEFELDDYDFARPSNFPTHWFYIPPPPEAA